MTGGFLALFALAACGHSEALREDAPPPPFTPEAPLAAPPAAAIGVTLSALSPGLAEDGAGGSLSVAAPISVAFSGGWGGRALDPVLVVGERRFVAYDHPAPGVLRYRVAERGLLVGPAWIAFGERETVDVSAPLAEALR